MIMLDGGCPSDNHVFNQSATEHCSFYFFFFFFPLDTPSVFLGLMVTNEASLGTTKSSTERWMVTRGVDERSLCHLHRSSVYSQCMGLRSCNHPACLFSTRSKGAGIPRWQWECCTSLPWVHSLNLPTSTGIWTTLPPTLPLALQNWLSERTSIIISINGLVFFLKNNRLIFEN